MPQRDSVELDRSQNVESLLPTQPLFPGVLSDSENRNQPAVRALPDERVSPESPLLILPDIEITQGAAPERPNPTNAAQNQPERDTLEQLIPGATELNRAARLMADQALSPLSRLEAAQPLFQQALDAASQIDLNKVDAVLNSIQSQGQMIEAQNPGKSPQQIAQENPEYLQLAQQQQVLTALRTEPMKVTVMYAVALNQIAQELKQKGETSPEQKGASEERAKSLNDLAATVLQNIAQIDPRFGNAPEAPSMVQGMLDQLKKGELLSKERALSLGLSDTTTAEANFAIHGPVPHVQPIWSSLGVAGTAFESLGKTSGVGVIEGIGAGLRQPTEQYRTDAEMKLARAKEVDAETAKQVIDLNKSSLLQQGVDMGNDLLTSAGSLGLANWGTLRLLGALGLRAAPAPVKLAAFAGIGLLGAAGIRTALDHGSHALFGTSTHSLPENLSRAAFDFAAAAAAQTGTRYMGQLQTRALGGTRPSLFDAMLPGGQRASALTESLTLNNGRQIQTSTLFRQHYTQLPGAARARIDSALSATPNMGAAQQYQSLLDGMKTARGAAIKDTYSWFNPQRYSSLLRGAEGKATILDQSGAVTKPFALGKIARAGGAVAIGGTTSSLFGAGTVNPLLTKEGTQERYNLSETASAAERNFVIGGVGSGLVGVVPELFKVPVLSHALGKAWDKTVAPVYRPVTQAASAITEPFVSTFMSPFASQHSNLAASFYGIHYWNELDAGSDKIIANARQQTSGTR